MAPLLPSRRLPPASRPSRRIVATAPTTLTGDVSPIRARRLSYLEAATTRPVLRVTPPRGAKSAVKDVAMGSTLIASVFRRSVDGDGNPVVAQRDVAVRVLQSSPVPAFASQQRTLTATMVRRTNAGHSNPVFLRQDVSVRVVHPPSPTASAGERVHGNRSPVCDVAPPALAVGGDLGRTEGVSAGDDAAGGVNALGGDNPSEDTCHAPRASANRALLVNVVAPPASSSGGDVGSTEGVSVGNDTAAGVNAGGDNPWEHTCHAPRAPAKQAMDDPFWCAPVPAVLTPPSHAVATPLPATVKTTGASICSIAGGAEKKAPWSRASKRRSNRSTVRTVTRESMLPGISGKPGRQKSPAPMPATMTPNNPGSHRNDVRQRTQGSGVVSPANGNLLSKACSKKTLNVRKGTPGRKKKASPKLAGLTTRQPALNPKRSQSKKTGSAAVPVTTDAASVKVSSQKMPPARKTKGNALSHASSGKTSQTRRKKPCTSLQNVRDLINNDVFTWARKTHTFGNKIKNQFTDADFIAWDVWFRKQIVQKFQRIRICANDRTASLGRGLRSVAKEDLLVDDEARLIHVTDARRLSRCHFEDLLRMQEGARVVVYFKTNLNSRNLCSELLSKPFF